jgi:hypothetical protein
VNAEERISLAFGTARNNPSSPVRCTCVNSIGPGSANRHSIGALSISAGSNIGGYLGEPLLCLPTVSGNHAEY